MGTMPKAKVQVRSENPNCWTRGVPAINVKWSPYTPDLVRKFEHVQDTSKHICQVCGKSGRNNAHDAGKQDHRFNGGGKYFVHEFGDDEQFWQWVEAMERQSDVWDYPNGAFTIADELARQVGWEDAHDLAYEVWGSSTVQVESSGRSGGWLIVRGLGDVEDWDAVELARWTRFQLGVESLLEQCDYNFVWHLHVNVYENWLEQFARAI